MELLRDRLGKTANNQEFLDSMSGPRRRPDGACYAPLAHEAFVPYKERLPKG